MYGASTVILIIISLLSAMLGLLVITRNSHQSGNRLFLGFAFAVTLWVLTNAFFQIASDATAYPAALLSYSAAVLIAVFLLQFCLVFTGRHFNKVLFCAGIIATILSAVPGVLASQVVNHEIKTTMGLIAYALVLVAHFATAIWLLLRYRRSERGPSRARTDVMLSGVFLAIVGGTIFNLFLPLIGRYDFVQFGPAFSLVMVGAIALAIIRHQLFDIRTIALRSFSYAILIAFMSTFYVWVVLRFVGSLLADAGLSAYVDAAYVVATLLLAISFQRLKRLFDRVTNELFFRDAYDTNEVLDRISDTLVTTIDTNRLSRETTNIVAKVLSPQFILVSLIQGDQLSVRAAHGQWQHKVDEAFLAAVLAQHPRSLVVRDNLAERRDADFAGLIDKADVAIILPLHTSEELLGYLVLGSKQSGNIYSKQDLDLLRIAGDQLAIAIQNSLRFEEIQTFNKTLQHKVDEATTELREKNRKLRALDIAKDEFISMASHQLRTPLTSVKGYISMVLDGDGGPLKSEQRKLLSEAYGSSQRMVYLIGDFLNVSRIRTGKFVVEPKPLRLTDLIKVEINQLAATAENRGLTLTYSAPEHFPTLLLDEEKTRQVIMNFIDNAIYYTPPGGHIDVALMVTRTEITFTVKDTGIGVPKAEQHKLFTKFYRAGNARQMRPDGTGIGLFLARKVIALQGGTIIFESRAGKGSIFGFRFPRRNALPDQEIDNPAH